MGYYRAMFIKFIGLTSTKPDRRIPVYFEYEYGIDFISEKEFLEKEGYIKDFQATQKGSNILKKYQKIIDEKNNQNMRPKLDLKKN